MVVCARPAGARPAGTMARGCLNAMENAAMAYEWDARLEKGIATMDAVHREFVEWVDRALKAADNELPEVLAALVGHTREHFAREDRWMEECGFPPIMIHRGEHQRVLGALEQALARARAGDQGPARQLIEQLPAWFEQHAATMDNALAMHMRRTGHPEAETSSDATK